MRYKYTVMGDMRKRRVLIVARGGGGCSGYKRPWGWRELFQVAPVAELGVGQLHGSCGWWRQWWQQLRVPHRFRVPEQRAEKLHGPCTAGGGIVTVLTCLVGLMSMETTGLTPVDSSTSLAQSNGVGIQFVGSSSIGCASVHLSLMVSSSFAIIFSQLSGVVVLIISGMASVC